jgi:uncharacterized protein YggE
MRLTVIFGFVFSLLCASPAFAQDNQINRQNRTIEVVATETVKVEPDIAEVTLGCVTYGETHDEAYQANLKTADQVIKALLAAGVSKEQIESSAIELGEGSSSENRPTPKGRQYEAHQSWSIRLAASQAQKIIDDAVQAGANGIENVSWDVSNPEALETKARVAAMKKARATAAAMAESGGAKLGELLYASNVVNGLMGLLAGRQVQTESASIGSGGGLPTPTFSLKLFPAKVEKQVTVRAIFALD